MLSLLVFDICYEKLMNQKDKRNFDGNRCVVRSCANISHYQIVDNQKYKVSKTWTLFLDLTLGFASLKLF
jgi:hypothetical protein